MGDRERAVFGSYFIVVGDVFAACVFDSDYTLKSVIGCADVGYTADYRCNYSVSFDYARTLLFVERIDAKAVVFERSAVVNLLVVVCGDGDRTRRDFKCALLVFGIGYRIVASDVFAVCPNFNLENVAYGIGHNVLHCSVADDSRFLSFHYGVFARDFEFVTELVLSVVYENCRFAFNDYRALGDFERAIGVFYLVIARYVF